MRQVGERITPEFIDLLKQGPNTILHTLHTVHINFNKSTIPHFIYYCSPTLIPILNCPPTSEIFNLCFVPTTCSSASYPSYSWTSTSESLNPPALNLPSSTLIFPSLSQLGYLSAPSPIQFSSFSLCSCTQSKTVGRLLLL